ncbi:C4-dicarboxylate transporter, DctM subunit [Halanaerobium congolense]|jgi:C4-dicarboxylate transporter DctM subunit|uniref:C4-dicarboxylate transporter DctM subunit n=1 Tax=Halanaerobium congolense TaxID=54121 RepID=A0A1G6T270_9FIRM|nr:MULTISPECIES: TRAP transporter large permease [Halanaerobium]PTX17315.1 C4-dicarboxylate transporter DctM subunit [Halanaerobium congolense]PUU87507.1 MAG: C4-dicarboxylate transporter, DctM subunit [Halanaerobium sp.]TDX45443.1 C4-dicarboxylate transporter DctM subunit [Halanaerobium congolense]SDD23109.1 C4-dicarboxylate transporter, DctM subunit [Halanaerobium congolense]SDF12704.1 C4-dicarboxylate transporter, DctM subunit [Halanaerobium congolense]
MALVILGSMVLLFIIGTPIAFSLGIASSIALLVKSDLPLLILFQRMFTGTDSFPLMAIPFFMLAGELMNTGGISKRLVKFAESLVGHIAGGLGMVSVIGAMFFAGISGAAAADTAAIGSISIPAMIRGGYKKNIAASIQAAGGSIGVIIPPSIPMVLFGVISGVSIGKLFLGGFVPGIIIGLGFMLLSYIIAKKEGYKTLERSSIKNVFTSFKDALWALIMPFIIIGGILAGIFTPTEASVVAVIYGLIAGLYIYKELQWKDIPEILVSSAITTSTIMFLIATATGFAWILTSEQIPQQISTQLLNLTTNPISLYFLMMVILLIMGTFVETSAALIVMVPIFFPIAQQIGLDPVHFGVMFVIALATGMLTPPLGICLFISCNIAKIQMSDIIKAIGPFVIMMISLMVLLILFPGIVTFIPDFFMG